jgi:hypothetical protein
MIAAITFFNKTHNIVRQLIIASGNDERRYSETRQHQKILEHDICLLTYNAPASAAARSVVNCMPLSDRSSGLPDQIFSVCRLRSATKASWCGSCECNRRDSLL